ncbi:MAG: F-box protein [Parachlamydiales bacterium]|jgi:hypothetical protein
MPGINIKTSSDASGIAEGYPLSLYTKRDIPPAIPPDNALQLPSRIFQKIFCLLPYEDVAACNVTCRYFHDIIVKDKKQKIGFDLVTSICRPLKCYEIRIEPHDPHLRKFTKFFAISLQSPVIFKEDNKRNADCINSQAHFIDALISMSFGFLSVQERQGVYVRTDVTIHLSNAKSFTRAQKKVLNAVGEYIVRLNNLSRPKPTALDYKAAYQVAPRSIREWFSDMFFSDVKPITPTTVDDYDKKRRRYSQGT